MGLFDNWGYTNFHELNLVWILREIERLRNVVENFVALNTIKYADPIQWNITSQYEANTVVIDPQSGTAYISTQPVPTGVAITNTDYWSVIFDLNILSVNQNITLRDDGSNVLSTFESDAGDWLIWNETLYKVTQHINTNEAYVVGYNLTRYTVELFIKDYINELLTLMGSLSDLNTSDKTSIVNAINELVARIDDVGNLKIFNVIDYGATGDGVTDDTDAIKACIEAGKYNTIYFPEGTYLISDSLTLYSLTNYLGSGINTTLIRVADGSNCGVFKSYDYDNYIVSPYTIPNTKDPQSMRGLAGSSFTSIKNMTIDAGFMNFSAAVVNTSGHGVAYIGKGLTIEDVEICNAPNVGLMIQMFYCNDFWSQTSNGSHDVNLQGFMNRLEVHDTGNEAIIKHGLQDPHCDNLRVYRALQSNVSFESLTEPCAVSLVAGSGSLGAMTFGSVHIHGTHNGYGLGLFGGVRIVANQLMVEDCHDGIYTEGPGLAYGSISNLNFHDITGVCFEYNSRLIIANLDAYNLADNAVVFRYTGGWFNILGGHITGANDRNTIVFDGSVACSLANINLQTQSVSTFNNITFTRSIIKVVNYGTMNLGTFQRCHLELVDNNNGAITFSSLNDALYLNDITYRSNTGSYPVYTHSGSSIGINTSVTTEQTITLTAPDNIGVTLEWRHHLEILGSLDIKYCYCSAVSGSTITFKLALASTGGTYTGYNLYIK